MYAILLIIECSSGFRVLFLGFGFTVQDLGLGFRGLGFNVYLGFRLGV